MTGDGLGARLRAALGPAITDGAGPVVVACSGGGDSVALLHLAADVFGADRLTAATVHHHLRAGAEDEIALVARHAGGLGAAHRVLHWSWDGQGNLQAAAREGRRALLSALSAELGHAPVLLGHTRDDQAETVLLRLARGSGVDGLAGMAAADPPWHRPLLATGRDELRGFLAGRGLDWAEDPSNDDPRFDRVRARRMMAALSDLGLTPDRLARTADLMRGEAEVLAHAEVQALARMSPSLGDLTADADWFADLPWALATRVLARVVRWYSGAPYKPRRDDLTRWREAIIASETATLSGVIAVAGDGMLRFQREPAAAAPATPAAPRRPTHWDHRWLLTPPAGAVAGLRVAALGDGVAELPDWRGLGVPRRSLETTPAIWDGSRLVAAPFAGQSGGWTARLWPPFAAPGLSH
ncbi:tRNA lysidine(34) synthetase TilS [Rhodobacterales bacterium HKCCE2091]|nr:tRNA lysidine(34) synthetase TilS [Rhodobacterales bacterium HKCCE2091]